MRNVLAIIMLFSSQVFAAPKLYEDAAAQHMVSADKLYALALSESGFTNEYGHTIPYPWSVTVNGRYYRFKSKPSLFTYLKKQMHTNRNTRITYGIAGRVLIQQSDKTLWDSLSVAENINYLASALENVPCKHLSQCIDKYRLAQRRTKYRLYFSKKVRAIRPTRISNNNINKIVAQVARQRQVDPALIHAVISQESQYKVHAKSHVGAMGLMQLMPLTAKGLGLQPSEYYDPYKNIDAGTRYLKQQLQTFGGDVSLALAAYNAGPGAVRKYNNSIPPYKETKKYVPKVLGYYQYFKSIRGKS